MKLVTFDVGGGQRAGAMADSESIVALDEAFAWHERKQGRASDLASVRGRYGEGVLGFIERAAVARPAADAILDAFRAKSLPAALTVRADSASLHAPIPRPTSMRDGYAFRQHVETARKNRGLEMIPEFDQFPVFYFTNHQAVIGPGALTVRTQTLERLDFELEAAIVVGATASDVKAKDADACIFGMTIMNDFSARALQMEEMKLSLGPAKGKDFATGLGPWLVTMDELAPRTRRTDKGNVYDLAMRAFVNGKQLSHGNVSEMTWTFGQILERVAYGVTLYPGDVIGSGTCGTGCFLELNGSKITDNQWLNPGDVVRLEIDQLGALENHVVARDD